MCGIFGILVADEEEHVVVELIRGLLMLQHRGQDAAGIVTAKGSKMCMRKSSGLVNEVFKQHHAQRLLGSMGVGHVRYPTAGGSGVNDESQPFYTNSPYGIALGHNGNLNNSPELRQQMVVNLRHVNTNSDTELLLNVFADELMRRKSLSDRTLRPEDVFSSVEQVHRRCSGSYAVVALVNGFGIVAFRDPNGIRPLVFGRRESKTIEGGVDWAVASESVALDVLGFSVERDVAPGEALFIAREGGLFTKQCALAPKLAPCIFEYVYFARPDSYMNGVNVYQSRLEMGDRLGAQILAEFPDHDVDVVIPIPDTSRSAAIQVSYQLKVPYREGFIKNRYIARTFIMPGQEQRKKSVRSKLNPVVSELDGKNVLLIDDSIVRGTTAAQIIELARQSGAKKVYLASAAPPVRFPNVYGIDMPTRHELIAHDRNPAEIAKLIGCDWLVYLALPSLIESIQVRRVRAYPPSLRPRRALDLFHFAD